jgi:hypothetical protein
MTREEAIFCLRELADMLEKEQPSGAIVSLVATVPLQAGGVRLAQLRYVGERVGIADLYCAIGACHVAAGDLTDDVYAIESPVAGGAE